MRAPQPEGVQDALALIRERRDKLRASLHTDSPECFEDQQHADGPGLAKTYWHYGYYIALKDVLALIEGPETPDC